MDHFWCQNKSFGGCAALKNALTATLQLLLRQGKLTVRSVFVHLRIKWCNSRPSMSCTFWGHERVEPRAKSNLTNPDSHDKLWWETVPLKCSKPVLCWKVPNVLPNPGLCHFYPFLPGSSDTIDPDYIKVWEIKNIKVLISLLSDLLTSLSSLLM